MTIFAERLTRPLARSGAAVLLVDHLAKNRESGNRFAIGAQAKLAGLDGAAYLLEVEAPFGHGRTGRSRILVAKDRPGHVASTPTPPGIASAPYRGRPDDGRVAVSITWPAVTATRRGCPTTSCNESRSTSKPVLTGRPEAGILDEVPGRKQWKITALDELASAGHVVVKEGARGARQCFLVTPYPGGSNES